MGFIDDLKKNTVEPVKVKNGLHDGKDVARKLMGDLEGKTSEEIAKKVGESSENKPNKVVVQNLTKVQSHDKDEIE